jgi:hypothetical protein
MVMFVLIAWVREIIIKPVAAALLRACRHIADGKALGHPISEDTAGLFGFEGKNRSSAVSSIIMVAAKARAIWQQTRVGLCDAAFSETGS